MSDTNIIVRVPVTVAIGDVPDDIAGHDQKATFALASVKRVLDKAGIRANVEGDRAVFNYNEDGVPVFVTTGGRDVGKRHHRLVPEGEGHALEISVDDGATFHRAGVFADYGLADAIGEAWKDGRIEAQ